MERYTHEDEKQDVQTLRDQLHEGTPARECLDRICSRLEELEDAQDRFLQRNEEFAELYNRFSVQSTNLKLLDRFEKEDEERKKKT